MNSRELAGRIALLLESDDSDIEAYSNDGHVVIYAGSEEGDEKTFTLHVTEGE